MLAMQKEINSEKITVTFTPSLNKAWTRAAKMEGITRFRFARVALQKEINRIEKREGKRK